MIKLKMQFGATPCKADIEKYKSSPNWKKGKFQNLEETSMDISFWDIPSMLYKQFTDTKNRVPKQPLPVLSLDKELFVQASKKGKFAWYGHSVVLLELNGKIVLIDPMLGPDASPIAPMKTKRFSENTLELIDSLPDIDCVLLSHDHYDHIDYDSIMRLKSKVKQWYVALGVKRHLVCWGIDESIITEFDWWDKKNLEGIAIHFTPTRHFSGRGVTDRAKSLWGGWVIKTESTCLYFSGDGGYGKHFQEVANKFEGFDFAFMECGQYNEKWRALHMFPDESAQVAKQVNAKLAMPVHWAGFALAQHQWKEPVELFTEKCTEIGVDCITPKLGEVIDLAQPHDSYCWWEQY